MCCEYKQFSKTHENINDLFTHLLRNYSILKNIFNLFSLCEMLIYFY